MSFGRGYGSSVLVSCKECHPGTLNDLCGSEEAIVTADDMPVEEESAASRQPGNEARAESDTEEDSSERETNGAAGNDIIIRHDMLIQRDDLQKYMQARPLTIDI